MMREGFSLLVDLLEIVTLISNRKFRRGDQIAATTPPMWEVTGRFYTRIIRMREAMNCTKKARFWGSLLIRHKITKKVGNLRQAISLTVTFSATLASQVLANDKLILVENGADTRQTPKASILESELKNSEDERRKKNTLRYHLKKSQKQIETDRRKPAWNWNDGCSGSIIEQISAVPNVYRQLALRISWHNIRSDNFIGLGSPLYQLNRGSFS